MDKQTAKSNDKIRMISENEGGHNQDKPSSNKGPLSENTLKRLEINSVGVAFNEKYLNAEKNSKGVGVSFHSNGESSQIIATTGSRSHASGFSLQPVEAVSGLSTEGEDGNKEIALKTYLYQNEASSKENLELGKNNLTLLSSQKFFTSLDRIKTPDEKLQSPSTVTGTVEFMQKKFEEPMSQTALLSIPSKLKEEQLSKFELDGGHRKPKNQEQGKQDEQVPAIDLQKVEMPKSESRDQTPINYIIEMNDQQNKAFKENSFNSLNDEELNAKLKLRESPLDRLSDVTHKLLGSQHEILPEDHLINRKFSKGLQNKLKTLVNSSKNLSPFLQSPQDQREQRSTYKLAVGSQIDLKKEENEKINYENQPDSFFNDIEPPSPLEQEELEQNIEKALETNLQLIGQVSEQKLDEALKAVLKKVEAHETNLEKSLQSILHNTSQDESHQLEPPNELTLIEEDLPNLDHFSSTTLTNSKTDTHLKAESLNSTQTSKKKVDFKEPHVRNSKIFQILEDLEDVNPLELNSLLQNSYNRLKYRIKYLSAATEIEKQFCFSLKKKMLKINKKIESVIKELEQWQINYEDNLDKLSKLEEESALVHDDMTELRTFCVLQMNNLKKT